MCYIGQDNDTYPSWLASTHLDAFKNENGSPAAAFIVDLVRVPKCDEPLPKAVDLGHGCLARAIKPNLSPNLKPRDWISAEIDDPGICALVFGIHIADDDGLAIA